MLCFQKTEQEARCFTICTQLFTYRMVQGSDGVLAKERFVGWYPRLQQHNIFLSGGNEEVYDLSLIDLLETAPKTDGLYRTNEERPPAVILLGKISPMNKSNASEYVMLNVYMDLKDGSCTFSLSRMRVNSRRNDAVSNRIRNASDVTEEPTKSKTRNVKLVQRASNFFEEPTTFYMNDETCKLLVSFVVHVVVFFV